MPGYIMNIMAALRGKLFCLIPHGIRATPPQRTSSCTLQFFIVDAHGFDEFLNGFNNPQHHCLGEAQPRPQPSSTIRVKKTDESEEEVENPAHITGLLKISNFLPISSPP